VEEDEVLAQKKQEFEKENAYRKQEEILKHRYLKFKWQQESLSYSW